MARKWHTAEEIFGKLRAIEVELAKGQSAPQARRKIGVTEPTYTVGARSTRTCGWTRPGAQGARARDRPARASGRGPSTGHGNPGGASGRISPG